VVEHYLTLSVNELIDDVLLHYRSMWPDIEELIRSHATDPQAECLVMEGSALWPESAVAALDVEGVTALWLTASDNLIQARIHASSGYDALKGDERTLVDKFLARNTGAVATFTATALALLPVSIRVVDGDGQTGAPGSDLPSPLIVVIENELGEPVVGVSVLFRVVEGSANLTFSTDTTDSAGFASTQITLGDVEGSIAGVAGIAGSLLTARFTARSFDTSIDHLAVVLDNLQRAFNEGDEVLYESIIDDRFWFTETDCQGELILANGKEDELDLMFGARDGSRPGVFDIYRQIEWTFTQSRRDTELGRDYPAAYEGDPDGHPDEDWEVFRSRVEILLLEAEDEGFRVDQVMNFKMRRSEDDLWRIVRWVDDPLSGDCGEAKAAAEATSWGRIKASFLSD